MKIVKKSTCIEYTIKLTEDEAQALGSFVETLSDYGPDELDLEHDGWTNTEISTFLDELQKQLPRQV
jgi:hypothetical protein